LLKEINKHLSGDSVLNEVILAVELNAITPNTNIFQSLVNSIISQQISLKAAESIYERLIKMFNPDFQLLAGDQWNQEQDSRGMIKPEDVVKAGEDKIRGAGLSRNKAAYIINVAQFALEQGLDYSQLQTMDDTTVLNYLTQIKGVGDWTAHMIMMFSLDRKDVFPLEDLSIRNSIISLYGLRDPNPPKNKSNHSKQLRQSILSIAEKWKPYRSYGCFYLWQYFESIAE